MPRKFIRELGQQDVVDEVFVASGKQLRPNRNGNLYLQVELSDRTGSISARLWNADETLYQSFNDGDYVRVQGNTQLFQGAVQMIAKRIDPVESDEVDPADFEPEPAVDAQRLFARLKELVRGIGDPALKTLAECFLLDDEFVARFTLAPAGTKHHHAYHGGLLEHTVGMMEAADRIAPCYPKIDRDLLVLGAMLHDIGKTRELGFQAGLEYTDEGQLVGHLVLAVEMLNDKVAEAERLSGEPIPAETVLRLKHMLLSHHGEYEYGSPKVPMTLEALALHCLDLLDSKLNAFELIIKADPNTDSPWTTYQPNLGRKIYKGANHGPS
ncbi:MAG: HD domain-containing protein [Thermoguttaceae bacterium]|jgi:3'-5' exoribonuclease|nr:HD domain-containing protein [Thermoguttaceae bacterium]